MRILVIDIGGSHVKFLATGHKQPVKFPSGPGFTPQRMVEALQKVTAAWKYGAVSIGYPGQVLDGVPCEDPPNLGKGWVGFDFEEAFGCPVKIINDSAMQALGSYRGGRMLFLGLGTGLGSTLIVDDVVHPMELGDLPYLKGGTFVDYVGKAGRKRLGRERWARHVTEVVEQLHKALQVEYTVVGGGGVEDVIKLPTGALRGHNDNAFKGGIRMWGKAGLRTDMKKEPTS